MNERKLIDEIKRLVSDDAISGYYNATTFNGDNGITYTNLITNNSPIGRGFIVPYNRQWLVVVANSNTEVRKNIIKVRRKIEDQVIKKYPVKTIFPTFKNSIWGFSLGGDQPIRKVKGNFTENSLLSDFSGFVVNLGKGNKYTASINYRTFNDGYSNRLIHVNKSGDIFDIEFPSLEVLHFFYYHGDGNWVANKIFISDSILESSTANTYAYYTVSNGSLNETQIQRTLNSSEIAGGIYGTPEDRQYNNATFTLGGGGTQVITTIEEPGSLQTFNYQSGAGVNSQETSVTLDCDYVFLSLNEETTIRHRLNVDYKTLILAAAHELEETVAEDPRTGLFSVSSQFISWIINSESIELSQEGSTKNLNVDKYLLCKPEVDLTEESTSFEFTVNDPCFVGNLVPFAPGSMGEGYNWQSSAPGWVNDREILLDPATYPFNEYFDKVEFNYGAWAARELYNPQQFIGENILYFYSKYDNINGKYINYIVKGVISNVSLANNAFRDTTFTISITTITPSASVPEPNVLTLDNGSFFSYALIHNVGRLSSNNKLYCKEILKVVTFTKNLPQVERLREIGSPTENAISPTEIGNEFYTLGVIDTNVNNQVSKLIQITPQQLLSRINIIKNKIYEVIEDPTIASKNKAAIAEWTITDDGKIIFEKVFVVGYLLNFISPIRSSYNPK